MFHENKNNKEQFHDHTKAGSFSPYQKESHENHEFKSTTQEEKEAQDHTEVKHMSHEKKFLTMILRMKRGGGGEVRTQCYRISARDGGAAMVHRGMLPRPQQHLDD